jgi:NADPH:quinone reductase-like Zn-dependent oxidoreductase
MKHDARFIGIGAAGIQHLKFGSFRAWTFSCGTALPLDRYSQCYRAVHRQPQKADMTVLSELLTDGRVVPVIDRRYDLDGVPEAPQYIEHGHARAKVAVRIS